MGNSTTIINKERNHGVTIAKAIAIILMVWGHSGCSAVIDHYLYLVRMPVFFIMSGYCFKQSYLDDGRKYLKRRVTGIYVPYIKWGLFFLLIHNILCHFDIYNVEYGGTEGKDVAYTLAQSAVKAVMMCVLMVGNDKLLGGFWFLHDLFFGSVLFYFALKLLRSHRWTPLVLLVLAMLTGLALEYANLGEKSMVVARTVFASSFISFGHCYKMEGWKVEKTWGYIVTALVAVFAVSLLWYVRFQDCRWMEMPLYAVLAVAGAIAIFGLGQKLDTMKCWVRTFLVYVGGKTFNILTWHMVSFKLVSAIIIAVYALPWARIAEFTIIGEYAGKGWNWVYLLSGVMIPVVWSYGYDKMKNMYRRILEKTNVGMVLMLVCSSLLFSCTATEDSPLPEPDNEQTDPEGGAASGEKNPEDVLMADTLRILDIGNSYSNDASGYLARLTQGMPLENVAYYHMLRDGANFRNWYNCYNGLDIQPFKVMKKIGGLDMDVPTGQFEAHDSVTFKKILEAKWDLIIVHQASNLATKYASWVSSDGLGQLQVLLNILKEHQPDATFATVLIHSYEGTYSGNSEKSSYLRWQNITSAMDRMLQDFPMFQIIIPYGTAIESLRASEYNTDHDLTRDGTHLAFGLGCYTAACVYYETLLAPRLGISVTDTEFTYQCAPNEYELAKYSSGCVDVTPENGRFAREAAKAACSDYRKIISAGSQQE